MAWPGQAERRKLLAEPAEIPAVGKQRPREADKVVRVRNRRARGFVGWTPGFRENRGSTARDWGRLGAYGPSQGGDNNGRWAARPREELAVDLRAATR
jgi:hypothetical protein